MNDDQPHPLWTILLIILCILVCTNPTYQRATKADVKRIEKEIKQLKQDPGPYFPTL